MNMSMPTIIKTLASTHSAAILCAGIEAVRAGHADKLAAMPVEEIIAHSNKRTEEAKTLTVEMLRQVHPNSSDAELSDIVEIIKLSCSDALDVPLKLGTTHEMMQEVYDRFANSPEIMAVVARGNIPDGIGTEEFKKSLTEITND